MPQCIRCGKEVGFLGSLAFNKQTGRCSKCESDVRQALARFRQAFLNYCQDGILTAQEWSFLQTGSQQEGLQFTEALEYVRGDALYFLDQSLSFAFADGLITEEEETELNRLRACFNIPDAIIRPFLDRLAYLKRVTELRRGILPTIAPSVRLESDELCHLESLATYHKVNAKSTSLVSGRLIATSKKLHFLSPSGGTEIPWKSVMRVDMEPSSIYLELSRKTGNGRYSVADPLVVGSTLDTLVRMAKHQLLAPAENTDSRYIPHEVRQAVWQRDQGKCVQCGATGPGAWLEFDHIIPHIRGGANTVGNVQLLCRRCNLQKGDRI